MKETVHILLLTRRVFFTIVLLGIVIAIAAGLFLQSVITVPRSVEQVTVFDVLFPLPMDTEDVERKLELVPELPGTRLTVTTQWLNEKHLRIHLRESDYPKGQVIGVQIEGARAELSLPVPPVRGQIIPAVRPELLQVKPKVRAPTEGTFCLRFSTMLDPTSFLENVSFSVPGAFWPRKVERGEKAIYDTSCWYFKPETRLRSDSVYQFIIGKNVRSKAGVALDRQLTVNVKTAPPLRLVKTGAEEGEGGVLPFLPLVFEFNQDLSRAEVQVFPKDDPAKPVPGETSVKGSQVRFAPQVSYRPAVDYVVKLSARAECGEMSGPLTVEFQSADLSGKLWVEVDNANQVVRVYRGSKIIRKMTASTGKASTPTPTGVYRVRGRGKHFYSYRYREGAYYWVRFWGNYLFHSVPIDREGNFIPEESRKLGTPASHGCVRLALGNAKWIFDHVPDGTLVIIRGTVQDTVPAGAEAGDSNRYLKVGIGSDPVTIDPQDAADNISGLVNFHMYETLVELTGELEIVPLLATHWRSSGDGLVWDFWLRRGVTFHDGTGLNADVVVRSFQRLIGPKSKQARRSILQPYVAAIKKTGEFTVRFILRYPLSTFLHHLTHGAAAIVSEEGEKLSGTGPFQLQEWVPGERLSLRRFPGYWGESAGIAGLSFIPVWDSASRAVLLEGGELDVVYPVPPPDVRRLRSHPNLEVISVPGQRIIYLGINNAKAPFSDVRVRRALNYAVDRKAITRHLLLGQAEPLDSPVANNTLGHRSFDLYPYDPEKAKQLLSEAGVDPGMKITIWTPVGRYPMDIQVAEAVAGYLQDVGFKPEIQRFEWGVYLEKLRTESHLSDLYLMGWSPATGQADWVLRPLLFSGARSNEAGYSNPELDELLLAVETETDLVRRQRLLQSAQEIVVQDAPWVFLFAPHVAVGFRRGLSGLKVHSLELLDFRSVFWGEGGGERKGGTPR